MQRLTLIIVKEMHPNKKTMTKEETVAEAKWSRNLLYAMQRIKQLLSEDDSAQASEHAEEIDEELNRLQIMKGHYQR